MTIKGSEKGSVEGSKKKGAESHRVMERGYIAKSSLRTGGGTPVYSVDAFTPIPEEAFTPLMGSCKRA